MKSKKYLLLSFALFLMHSPAEALTVGERWCKENCSASSCQNLERAQKCMLSCSKSESVYDICRKTVVYSLQGEQGGASLSSADKAKYEAEIQKLKAALAQTQQGGSGGAASNASSTSQGGSSLSSMEDYEAEIQKLKEALAKSQTQQTGSGGTGPAGSGGAGSSSSSLSAADKAKYKGKIKDLKEKLRLAQAGSGSASTANSKIKTAIDALEASLRTTSGAIPVQEVTELFLEASQALDKTSARNLLNILWAEQGKSASSDPKRSESIDKFMDSIVTDAMFKEIMSDEEKKTLKITIDELIKKAKDFENTTQKRKADIRSFILKTLENFRIANHANDDTEREKARAYITRMNPIECLFFLDPKKISKIDRTIFGHIPELLKQLPKQLRIGIFYYLASEKPLVQKPENSILSTNPNPPSSQQLFNMVYESLDKEEESFRKPETKQAQQLAFSLIKSLLLVSDIDVTPYLGAPVSEKSGAKPKSNTGSAAKTEPAKKSPLDMTNQEVIELHKATGVLQGPIKSFGSTFRIEVTMPAPSNKKIKVQLLEAYTRVYVKKNSGTEELTDDWSSGTVLKSGDEISFDIKDLGTAAGGILTVSKVTRTNR